MKNKLNSKAWGILKGYLENCRGEIHHYSGKQYEYLNCMLPLSVEEHRGKNPAKNYKDIKQVPDFIKQRCLKFWESILTQEHIEWFKSKGYWAPTQ